MWPTAEELVVDVTNGWEDWLLAFVPPVLTGAVAVVVVLLGGRLTDRQLQRTSKIQRELADETLRAQREIAQREHELQQMDVEGQAANAASALHLELRKWEAQQRREAYGALVGAISQMVMVVVPAASQRMSPSESDYRAAIGRVSESVGLVKMVGSDEYLEELGNFQFAFEQLVSAVGSSRWPDVLHSVSPGGAMHGVLRELIDAGRSEVVSLEAELR